MSLRTKHFGVSAVAGLTLLLALGGSAGSQSTATSSPSLESLKTIEYKRSSGGGQQELVGYSELLDVVISCRAYSRGLGLLPKYHEPILTRGQTGIAVFRKVSPSVVLVVTGNYKDDQLTDVGLGTGVLIDDSGYVLTNWHVITGYQVGVVFMKPAFGTEPSKNSAYGAKLVAQDPQADLALLKIVKAPAELSPVKFGEISGIQVAEDIHIIGHPHGQLWSYSTGVVSQIRDNYDWKYTDGSKHLAKVLQMQTAINPGNSGGPVLDDNGNMLGLVAMSEEGQNLNYAIAIDVIRGFVSRSMAARSRGTEARSQMQKGDLYSGQTKDGLSVTKAVYSDLVSYTMHDSKGSAVELIAEISDGETVRGTKPNAFGGFGVWSLKLASGKTIVVNSAGTAPELITAGKGE